MTQNSPQQSQFITPEQVLAYYSKGLKSTRLKAMAQEIARLANANNNLQNLIPPEQIVAEAQAEARRVHAETEQARHELTELKQHLSETQSNISSAQDEAENILAEAKSDAFRMAYEGWMEGYHEAETQGSVPSAPETTEPHPSERTLYMPTGKDSSRFPLPGMNSYSVIYTSDFQDELANLLAPNGNQKITERYVAADLLAGTNDLYKGPRPVKNEIMVIVEGVHVGWVSRRIGEKLMPFARKVISTKKRILSVRGIITREESGCIDFHVMLPSYSVLDRLCSSPLPELENGDVPSMHKFIEAERNKHTQRTATTLEITTPRANTQLAGEYYFSQNYELLLGAMSPGDRVTKHNLEAELIPDPQNPHDKNAVEVHIAGYMLGFLPREKAQDYSPLIRKANKLGKRVITQKSKVSFALNKENKPTPSVSIGIMTAKQLKDAL